MDRENWWIVGLVVGGILLVMLVICAAVFIIAISFFGLSTRVVQPLPPPPAVAVPTEAPVPSVVPPVESPIPTEETPEAVPDDPSDDPLDAEMDAEMDAVEEEVVDLRGLLPRQDVPRSLITPEELRQQVTEEFFEDCTAADAADEAIILSAFGFVPADLDLYALYVDLYSEQVAGYYDSEEEAFYVISTETGTLSASDAFIYAHEYTHALQDQHFDLDTFLYYDDDEWWEANADAGTARMALIEGDATLLQMLYLGTMSPEEMTEMVEEMTALDTPVFNSAPKYIRQSLLFPYEGGLTFVQVLYDAGGFDLVDAAYADPPLSTEQILHPERYFDGDDPQVVELEDDLVVLGDDYRQVLPANTFGEFNLNLFLQQHMTGTGADQATEGWDGDLYAAYHNDDTGETVIVMLTVWDNPGEAEEFIELIDIAWQTGQDPTCHRDQNITCVATLAADETLTIIAPDRETVDLILDNYR